MRKTNKTNPEPYEDTLRLEKLDPYETLIKSDGFMKKNNKLIEYK